VDIVFRAVVLYCFIVLVTRVIGRRELSSLAPIDLILLIVVGDAIQQGLTQSDYSVTGAVIAVATLAAMQVLFSYASFRSRRARLLLEGDPIVVMQDGKMIDRNLQRERMTPEDLAAEMRMQQIATFDEVEWAILEPSGTISFVKKGG
jgi:uncharacterized membrane protein YcaP (DUF421 family)